VNDVSARPLRSFLTGLNLTLGAIGIIFGLTLNQIVDTYRNDPALLGVVYDAIVTREISSDSRARHLLEGAPGVAAFYGELVVEVETPAEQSFQVRAVEGDLEQFPFVVNNGHLIRPNTYEAIAGQGLLDWLNLGIGDEITALVAKRGNRPVTWRIVGQYPEMSNAGQMLMVNLGSLQQVLRQSDPQTYYLLLEPDVDIGQLQHHLELGSNADLNLLVLEESIPESILYLQVAVFALAAILIGIALINVFNTTLMAIRERLRSIGVLKTVGMTPVQIVTMINTSSGFLGLLATVIGIPLGVVFAKLLFGALSRLYGVSGIGVSLNAAHALITVPLVGLVSVLGSVIPALGATRASIVQVIRSE